MPVNHGHMMGLGPQLIWLQGRCFTVLTNPAILSLCVVFMAAPSSNLSGLMNLNKYIKINRPTNQATNQPT